LKSLLFQGHKLKQLRESNSLTMQDMEEMTGIKQSSQSDIETGKNKSPRPATVDKLCVALKVDPIYFYFDGDNLSDLFPSEMPSNIREFVFNVENLPYLELAAKLKHPKIKLASIENLLMAYLKSAEMNNDNN